MLLQTFSAPGRLLFAWAEDLPQGIIGFVLTGICFSQPERGLGFAALSAVVSLAKGCLIPAGQGCLDAWLRYVLRQKLDVRNLDFSSTELLGLPRDELRASLPPILQKHTVSVIADMTLRPDLDLHAPLFEALDRWPESQDLEKIDAMSVAALKEEGADLQAVFAKGYSLKAAHAGGFALSACLAAGIGLQECLHAGFHLPEELRMSSNKSTLDAHEMEILRRVEAAGRWIL